MQLCNIASAYLSDTGLLAVLLQTGPVSRAEALATAQALLNSLT